VCGSPCASSGDGVGGQLDARAAVGLFEVSEPGLELIEERLERVIVEHGADGEPFDSMYSQLRTEGNRAVCRRVRAAASATPACRNAARSGSGSPSVNGARRTDATSSPNRASANLLSKSNVEFLARLSCHRSVLCVACSTMATSFRVVIRAAAMNGNLGEAGARR